MADAALYWAKNHGKNRSCIYSPSVVRIFTSAELAETAERNARLRAAEGLIRVVDAKDTYAGAHSQSVSRLVEGIARAMGLEEEVVEQVRLAGLLHDLGKIAIPDAILQKPGRLDPEELRTMREHADLGYRLLEGLGVSPVDRWIRHHHEWWDGSGYPLGLAGEEIPLGSRIILVADAFDAMTSDRCYRAARTPRRALWRAPPAVVDAVRRPRGGGARAVPGVPRVRTSPNRRRWRRPADGVAPGFAPGARRRARLRRARGPAGGLCDPRRSELFYAALGLQLVAFPTGVLPWAPGDRVATWMSLAPTAAWSSAPVAICGSPVPACSAWAWAEPRRHPRQRRSHAGTAGALPRGRHRRCTACTTTASRWPIPTCPGWSTGSRCRTGCRLPTSSRSATR